MPFTFYWPLAALDFTLKTRQVWLSSLYLGACFNPVLAWWLAVADKDTAQSIPPVSGNVPEKTSSQATEQPA